MVPADHALRVPGEADGLRHRAERRGMPQFVRFACVGVASTAAFTAIYLALREVGVSAQAANAVSQFLTAVGNTAANRRLTFGIRGTAHLGRHHVQGLIAFGVGLLVTSVALAVLHAVSARPGRITEVSVLVIATIVATLVRFALYKSWVFRPRRRS